MLAAVLAVALAARMAAAAVIESPLESDYLAYWLMAKGGVEGHGLVNLAGQVTAFYNIGYSLVLWAVFAVTGPSIAAVKATNIALGVVTVLLGHLAGRQLFRSWQAGAMAALLMATYAEAVAYTAYAAKENLLNPLLMAQLALVAGPIGRRLPLNAGLFGVATGWVAMVGNVGISLLPGMVVQAWFATGTLARFARYATIALVLAGLTIAPLLWRNHALFGHWVLNNNGGLNLYIGNNPNATGQFQPLEDTPVGTEGRAVLERSGEQVLDAMLRRLALQHMQENPGATLALAVRKAVMFWTPPTHAGRSEGTAERAVRMIWLAQFYLICGLFVAAMLQWRRHWRSLVVLLLFVAGFTAAHMAYYVSVRYRLPIMMVLCLGAGSAAWAGLSAWAAQSGPGPRRTDAG